MARISTPLERADSGTISMLASWTRREEILRAPDFGSTGQKRQPSWIGAQRHRDGVRHLPLQRRVGLRPR